MISFPLLFFLLDKLEDPPLHSYNKSVAMKLCTCSAVAFCVIHIVKQGFDFRSGKWEKEPQMFSVFLTSKVLPSSN